MTTFIRERGLLDSDEIDRIGAEIPSELIRFQEVAAKFPIEERRALAAWLDRFNEAVSVRSHALV